MSDALIRISLDVFHTAVAFAVVFFPVITLSVTLASRAIRRAKEARATVRLSQNPPKRRGGWQD